jgi:hypothetical protein
MTKESRNPNDEDLDLTGTMSRHSRSPLLRDRRRHAIAFATRPLSLCRRALC